MKRKKGSFTIEAAILIPFILFLLVCVLEVGIQFYQESRNREHYDKLIHMDSVAQFYTLQKIGEIGEEILEREP